VGFKPFSSRRSKNRLHRAAQTVDFIEPLEGRRLLAGTTAVLTGSALAVTGRPNDDKITITEANSNVVVKSGTQQIGSFASSSVKSIVVNGGKGDDAITVSLVTTGTTVTISGGVGNDTITGSGNVDLIYGNAGNDIILGLAGNDTIYGNGGNDSINGGLGDDVLVGGSGSDSILGLDGNDSIQGNGGGDLLDGGVGNDSLDGGGGVDTLNGGDGNDTLRAGAGGDTTDGGQGADLALTQGRDHQINVENSMPANAYVPLEISDLGLTATATADPVTGKHYTVTITLSKIAASSTATVVWKNHSGNIFNFVVDAKKFSEDLTQTAASRTFNFDLGTVDPGAHKLVIYSASGKSSAVTSFTVTWIAPTG
jgi:Ca2+-binding RTX toxin-like protein